MDDGGGRGRKRSLGGRCWGRELHCLLLFFSARFRGSYRFPAEATHAAFDAAAINLCKNIPDINKRNTAAEKEAEEEY